MFPIPTATLFQDRTDAGQQLAAALVPFRGRSDVLVLALPRGGVPVAYEICRRLDLPLDVLNVRKLGVPRQKELAMGAIASGNVVHLDEELVHELCISPASIKLSLQEARMELARREKVYRQGRSFPSLLGKTVILVDDGIATGSTMLTAITAVRQLGCYRVVVAVPLAPASTCAQLRRAADQVVCLAQPEPFYSIGDWYADFEQLNDQEVLALLPQVMIDPAENALQVI
jgi:putative phosphoribosyl transferase